MYNIAIIRSEYYIKGIKYERERILKLIDELSKNNKPLPNKNDKGYWTALTSKEVRHNVLKELKQKIEK